MNQEDALQGGDYAVVPPNSVGGGKSSNDMTAPLLATKPVPITRKYDAGALDSSSQLTPQTALGAFAKAHASDSEEGFLSTSPDSANGEVMPKSSKTASGVPVKTVPKITVEPLPPPICLCTNPTNCVTVKNILDSFKSPLSEEQAWALIFQFMALYRRVAAIQTRHIFTDLEIPDAIEHMNVHRDGSVHCSWSETELREKEQQLAIERQSEDERGPCNLGLLIASHKKILRKVAVIVYTALDYNLQEDEQCQMSQELEELISYMTAEEIEDDCIDEGIDEGYKRWDDEHDDGKYDETKEFDYVLQACKNHVKPTAAEDHYRAVCRALVTETIELGLFLEHVLSNGTDELHAKVDAQTSKQELAKLGFNDWARFWVQVIDELRQGVRLKKNTYTRTPIEYELTPYEILMEDIRSRKYQLRKVMVNGDIPPRVKKDAHALILEFIRSRPPLKKASERKLPPPIQRTPSPREQLMDSIRKGQTLKHIQPPSPPRLKDRLLPPSTAATVPATSSASSASAVSQQHTLESLKLEENMNPHTTPRSKQRLIKVDFSLLQDDDTTFFDETSLAAASSTVNNMGTCAQPKMPPYPIGGYMVPDNTAKSKPAPPSQLPTALTTRVLRRTTYDLATQCESRRASLRRHTIVGCQSNFDETHSMPPSRPSSRQSDTNSIAGPSGGVSATKQLHNNYNKHQQQQQQQLKRSQSPAGHGISNNCNHSSSSVGPWNKSFLDEKTWNERGDDRLSLTLEEIVHIRSVMTKAELEGLPVGVRVKEDVEKRKVCFLCLRTRFSIFGPWGIQCKLCQRTVCSKCYTKMRMPSEHFRKVPLVLISPSLLASPAGSSSPSPSHHGYHNHSSSTGNILDENFPKSLIERLLRSESERKTRNSVGSAPSSPKHQRSNMSTPGITATPAAAQCSGAVTGHAVEAIHASNAMTASYTSGASYSHHPAQIHAAPNGSYYNANREHAVSSAQLNNKHINNISLMSRSMEGPRSLPANSPARTHSNSSTLERKSKFSRAFTLSSSGTQLSQDQKENVRGEEVPVCNDCRGLVMEITRSSKQTRSSARNRALQNLTLDLSPVYK